MTVILSGLIAGLVLSDSRNVCAFQDTQDGTRAVLNCVSVALRIWFSIACKPVSVPMRICHVRGVLTDPLSCNPDSPLEGVGNILSRTFCFSYGK